MISSAAPNAVPAVRIFAKQCVKKIRKIFASYGAHCIVFFACFANVFLGVAVVCGNVFLLL